MTINENTRVKVISGYYRGRTGKVTRFYNWADFAFVTFDDTGDVGKVVFSDLVEIPEEIPEDAKEITRSKYNEALLSATQTSDDGKYLIAIPETDGSLTGYFVGMTVGDYIFKDKDVVVMTEEEFISTLWEGCNPILQNEKINNQMKPVSVMDVSITGLLTMRKLARCLFGDSVEARENA